MSNVDLNKISKRNISSANINRYNSIVSESNYINSEPNQQIYFQKEKKELLAKGRYNQFSIEYPTCKTDVGNCYQFSEGNNNNVNQESEKDFNDYNDNDNLDGVGVGDNFNEEICNMRKYNENDRRNCVIEEDDNDNYRDRI